jgi:RNA-binding protein NOB1
MTSTQKPVHTLVLDAGPILKNDPAVSILIAKCESLVTVPSVLSEIRDVNARSRVETLLRPFLTVRNPEPESINFVTEFSRRTGDLSVLSRPDIQILALAYELELERNNGDWRLRRTPGQRKLNGLSPELQSDSLGRLEAASQLYSDHQPSGDGQTHPASEKPLVNIQDTADYQETDNKAPEEVHKVTEHIQSLQLKPPNPQRTNDAAPPQDMDEGPPEEQLAESDSSNSEGWITPSNLKNQQAKDQNAATVPIPDDQVMQVATITTDFAMQVRTLTPELKSNYAKSRRMYFCK